MHGPNKRQMGNIYSVQSSYTFHRRFRSVVVITSASHAEGRRFDPGRKHLLLFRFSFTFEAFY